MRKSTTKKQTMLLLAALSCSAAMMGVVAWKNSMVTAETAINADRFALVDGASVRLKENDNGIRFQVEMGANVYDSITQLDGDVVASKAGMFVVPYSFVSNANAYETGAEIGEYEKLKQKIDIVFYDSTNNEIENKIYQDGDYYYANGAVVDMKFANLNVEYVGIGYVALTTDAGTTYDYTPITQASNARTIAYVAGGTYADYNEESSQAKVLKNYVYGALLGEMETNAVAYNEQSGKYSYNATEYDTIDEILTTTSATSEFTLNKDTLSMLPNTYSQLSAQMSLTINGETKTIATGANFVSSDPEKVSVSKTGEVTALAVGSATITATTMGKTTTCVVTVEDTREEKTLNAADFDLSANAAFTTTLDDGETLISVKSGDTDLTQYATLDGTMLSIPYAVMSQAPTGVNELTIGTQNYVYTQEITVATYVVSDKASFDKFFTAYKADNENTQNYYVVMKQNAVIDLGGSKYESNASSNHFLGVLDGRGAILKNLETAGGGLFGRTSLKGVTGVGATFKDFAIVNVTSKNNNGAMFATNLNTGAETFSNIYVQGEIQGTGTDVIRSPWNNSSKLDNMIINVTKTNAGNTSALIGGSGSTTSTQGILNHIYAITNVDLYEGTKITGADNVTYDSETKFFQSVTSLSSEDGWSSVWSFDGKGNLCFGGNIVMTKPDMRVAKDLGEAYYQKGSSDDLTITLDAGETVESMTVGGNDVTSVADKSVAGQVTIPAAAIASLATNEYEVAISTANYKYVAEFVYADVVISTCADWCEFLIKNRNGDIKYTYEGEYIVLKNDVDFTEFNYKNYISPTTNKHVAAWTTTTVQALNVTANSNDASFNGTLDGRGHAVINFGAVIGVFEDFRGAATVKDIAFIGLKNNFTTTTHHGLAEFTKGGSCTIENVFISVEQNGSKYQTGVMRDAWATTNIKNVIVVKTANGTATNFGIAEAGVNISNCYAINATYMKGTDATGITTATTLLGDTIWLTADNGWNTDVWTVNSDGDLCFGGDVVLEKPVA